MLLKVSSIRSYKAYIFIHFSVVLHSDLDHQLVIKEQWKQRGNSPQNSFICIMYTSMHITVITEIQCFQWCAHISANITCFQDERILYTACKSQWMLSCKISIPSEDFLTTHCKSSPRWRMLYHWWDISPLMSTTTIRSDALILARLSTSIRSHEWSSNMI